MKRDSASGHLTLTEAHDYARRIRSPQKKAYALAWIEHRFHGAPEPERPEGLAYMAAQGVRLEIGFPSDDHALPTDDREDVLFHDLRHEHPDYD